MMTSAGTSMCHGNFTYWVNFINEETGKNIRLNKYISKTALWEDMKNAGATTSQVKEAKEQMKKAPTKKMYMNK